MRYTTRMLFFLGILCSGLYLPLSAQSPTCGPDGVIDTSSFSGTAFFNYGSSARLTNQNYRSASAVGQTFVGYIDGLTYNSTLGFYARYLLAPFALSVTATQGDLLDRIQLSWEIDAVGPSPTEGFNIYRDGIYLATVGPNIRNYNDFNVIAGRAYIYKVTGLNVYGEGAASTALGFQVPNGVVTGWVQTINGSPVPDAIVTLMPMQGFSVKFGPLDGAFAETDTSGNPFMPATGEDWTMTFWIKTDAATAHAGLIQLTPFPLYFRALNSAGGHEGVEVAISQAGAPFLTASFPDSTKNGWHHVALSFDGSGEMGRLYIDGVLADLSPMNIVANADAINLGSRTGTGGWAGKMDELRIYHQQLDELDFREVMEGTASSLTPGLSHYWKMDEELGVKSYDIVNRHKLYFCGAAFDADRPPVRTAGKTNEEGYYRIESASYGTGTTFLAEPMKEFYMHRALKMVRDESDYATLPDFSVSPKATLELWINSAGPDGDQCVLSKRWVNNDFRLLIKPNGLENEVWFYLNGQQHNFGILGMGYQHLAFTMDSVGNNRIVTAFKNGIPFGSPHTFGSTGNWSDPNQNWILGARPSGNSYTDHFGGLMDEVALYDTTLSAAAILDHFQNSRDMQGKGLRVYFSLDEGSGTRVNNSGSVFLGYGTNVGGEWSPFAANQMIEPHEFTPTTRQVTLNPSVTSVDGVDFTDRSTIPVSGFVRYKNTDCFAPNVEIYVNGAPFSPRIFTDSTGRFVIDVDPGATATLTPVLEDHVFVPALLDVTNVVSPIAGILFNDITTRKVSGQVAGGLCKKSVIKAPPGVGQGTFCIVKVRSVDGCLERQITIDNQEGFFEFDNLPPLESMTVAVVEHSDPDIKTAFQVQGGSTVNLTKKDTMLDFIYIAQPTIELFSGLPSYSPSCDLIVLDQFQMKEIGIKLKEQYITTPTDNGICYIDTAHFKIINGFGDEIIDTAMNNGLLTYKFRVGTPNPTPPYLKTLQIISTTLDGNDSELTLQALVTGIRAKDQTFTTVLPERPTMILRDPPGDGSYSFLEKHEKFCQKISFTGETTAGAGLSVIIDLGADGEIPTFFGFTDVLLSSNVGPTITSLNTITNISSNTMEVCTSLDQRLSTSEEELVVGGHQGGDVYMGGGLNVEFGFADIVEFDSTSCSGKDSITILVVPGNYATTFIYSEWNIKNNVIRYLQDLANLATDSAEQSLYVQSLAQWNTILSDNAVQKQEAKFVRNISFDAGANYEYSETSDTTSSSSNTHLETTVLDVDLSFQGYLQGIGGGVIIKTTYEKITGQSEDGMTEKGVTTGYVLKDNDPGDAFSVDVAIDSVYKTPVFRLQAGQSSCPWEFETAKREGVLLTSVDGPFRTDVPANEPATFHFIMGNTSATNETFTYGFTAGPESNPHGAKIFCNGAPMNQIQWYAIPYGTSLPVTVTLERGPVEYDYDDLEIVLYSVCEDLRANALGILPDTAQNLYSAVYISAHFIRPCSEVNINVPEQNWVVINNDTNQPGTLRRITASGYDLSSTDFQLIRIQYRRTDGDGAWINIPGVSDRYNPNWSGYADFKLLNPDIEDLQPDFTQFFWETAGLSDGPYEIHAWAVCTGDASNKPGYSEIIKGRIDREPPSLIGTPQPSDGVFNVGDEISFTFNQHINCNKLIPADLTQPNNVALYDAFTNELIDIDVTCFENKIIIDPNFQNEIFENRVLRAELHDIEDLTGNVSTFLKWEFYVDRNELAWLTDSLGMTKYEDQTKTAVANIHNRGGYPVPFTITGIPDWVHVVPNQGTLAPNEIRPISFTVDSTAAFGLWSDSITLHTETGQNLFFMGGDEGLPFGVRVVCRPPNWEINPNLWENSENMVLELNIQGEVSTDVEDMVVAYIGDTLCGRAHVRFVPAVNKYLAYLTVYGNPNHVLLPLRLEIWDASACLRYSVEEDYFLFQPDDVIGDPIAPQVIHTNSFVLRDVPFGFGWNWLSFNLDFPDPDLDVALESLKYPENDLMKGQNAFSTYLNGAGWLGTLHTLGNTSMYIYRADMADTLKMLGTVLNPATTPIPVVGGWNWIGYIPNYSLPVNQALSSLSPHTGDLIKSQEAFAQYINPTFGWVGNLQYMQPPKGYQIKLAAPGTLIYPPPSSNLGGGGQGYLAQARGPMEQTAPLHLWTVDPTQFENSMTLIGMFESTDTNSTTSTMELGAFVGNQVRGSSPAIYIPPLESYLFFLTVYANSSGEQVKYKLFDSSNGAIQDLNETMYFSPDLHQGSIENPVPFTMPSSGTQDLAWAQSFEVQPNPFHSETMFGFVLQEAQEVTWTVTDVNGRVVLTLNTTAREGLNTMVWKGQSDKGTALAAGVYFVRLQTATGSVVRKVVLQ